MKNILRFGLFAALATVSLSCAKETVDNTSEGEREMVEMTFTADNGVMTKTYLDGNAVKWHEDDVIGIHDGYCKLNKPNTEVNQQFSIKSMDSDGSAVFQGTAAAGREIYYATYPYDTGNFVTEDGLVRIGFKSTQTASAPGTFDKTFNSSLAILKDGKLNFQNLGGLLKFTLTQGNVKKVTLTANDGGTTGGVYYAYFNEDGTIDETRTNLASKRASMILQPAGSTTFAPGTYYFVLSARTFTGGIALTFVLDNGKTMTATCTEDIVVERSKITNIGTLDTTYQEEEVFTPVTFPVVFPMGIKDGVGSNNPDVATNTWVQEWYADDACSAPSAANKPYKQTHWTGHHGTLYSAEQPQATMKWVWDEKITTLGISHFIETTTSAGSGISTVGIKGIWTDDYFEFVLPVKDFAAGTTLNLSMSLYTREGPTFWAVEYKDGNEWETTAVDNLPAYEGATVTAKATWALKRIESSSIEVNRQTVDITFDNAITQGEILIRVKCVDGSIQSTKAASGYVNTGCTKPYVSGSTAAAPFYFWNPGNHNNQDIVIDIVNI